MKSWQKLAVLLFLIIFVMVACGPMKPVAIVTETKSPTATSTLSNTPTTQSLLSLSQSNGPDKDISSYRLRTWTEDNYSQILDSLNNLVGEDDGKIPSLIVPDYLVAFQLEHLLNFPGSPSRNEILWNILFNKPGTVSIPGVPTTDDLMSLIISSRLSESKLVNLKNEPKI